MTTTTDPRAEQSAHAAQELLSGFENENDLIPPVFRAAAVGATHYTHSSDARLVALSNLAVAEAIHALTRATERGARIANVTTIASAAEFAARAWSRSAPTTETSTQP